MSMIETDTNLYQTLGMASPEAKPSSSQLQLEDFLNLMITELTHQDPFKPMENTEMATQISQFATVSGIEQLNTSFSGLSGSLLSDQSLQAANLVGREVLAPIDQGYLEAGETIDGVIGLPEAVSDLTVSVYTPGGSLVREIPLGTKQKGEAIFHWDGMTDEGVPAAPGAYRLDVRGESNGEIVAPYMLTQAKVSSVSLGAGGQGLQLNLEGLGSISFEDVAEIR